MGTNNRLMVERDKNFFKEILKQDIFEGENYINFTKNNKINENNFIGTIIFNKSLTSVIESTLRTKDGKLINEDEFKKYDSAGKFYSSTPIGWEQRIVFMASDDEFSNFTNELARIMMIDFLTKTIRTRYEKLSLMKTSEDLDITSYEVELLFQSLLMNVKVTDMVEEKLMNIFKYIQGVYSKNNDEKISLRFLIRATQLWLIENL